MLGVAGAAVANAPMVMGTLARQSEPVDVMIVGSGFGGAVAALRLGEQGYHTVLLERGKRWPITEEQNTFSSLQNPDGRSAWLSETSLLGYPRPIDRYTGVLEIVLGNGIAALAGSGVGGGSLIYAGALLQPTEEMFHRIFRDSVDYGEMDSVYYPKVNQVIRARKLTNKLRLRPEYAGVKEWLKLGKGAGLDAELISLGVHWGKVRRELKGKLLRSVVSGDFWYGNNSGAKDTLDTNYLSMAEARGYLEILPQQNVTSIEQGPDGRYLVSVDEIDTNGMVERKRQFVVRKLFLAAGSMGTSRLLVNARGQGLLPNLDDYVGMGWGNNGDFFSDISGFSSGINPNLGGPVTGIVRDFDNPIAPVVVECYANWALEGQGGTISTIGMSISPPKGYFSYDPELGDSVLNWPTQDPQVQQVIEAGSLTYERLLGSEEGRGKRATALKSGFYQSRLPRDGLLGVDSTSSMRAQRHSPIVTSVTAHPLGGVVLGQATDNLGMINNHEGLYAIDGSLIPGHTGCANPALTIAALAERNIEKIIQRDFN